jgi:hypothetical protein
MPEAIALLDELDTWCVVLVEDGTQNLSSSAVRQGYQLEGTEEHIGCGRAGSRVAVTCPQPCIALPTAICAGPAQGGQAWLTAGLRMAAPAFLAGRNWDGPATILLPNTPSQDVSL